MAELKGVAKRAQEAKAQREADELARLTGEKPARPPKPDAAPRKETAPGPSRKRQIRAVLDPLNATLLETPLAADALAPAEAELLTGALDRWQQQSPWLRQALERLAKASGPLGLMGVVALLALPRLARHDLIPDGLSRKLVEWTARDAQPVPFPSVGLNGSQAWANSSAVPPVYTAAGNGGPLAAG